MKFHRVSPAGSLRVRTAIALILGTAVLGAAVSLPAFGAGEADGLDEVMYFVNLKLQF